MGRGHISTNLRTQKNKSKFTLAKNRIGLTHPNNETFDPFLKILKNK